MSTFREVGDRLRNWGRWGEDDERGTLNFITPDRVAAAAQLVRTGKTFSLGIPVDSNGPGIAGGRPNPMHMVTEIAQVIGGGIFNDSSSPST